jgi:hypothetical protein
MSQFIDVPGKGKVEHFTIKEALKQLTIDEHYLRSLVQKYEMDGFAIKGGAQITQGGIENVKVLDGGVTKRMVPQFAIDAFNAKQAAGGRVGGGGALDGKKGWKGRLSPEQLASLQAGTLSADNQIAFAATLKNANNYNPTKSKAYRAKRKAVQAAEGDADDENDEE